MHSTRINRFSVSTSRNSPLPMRHVVGISRTTSHFHLLLVCNFRSLEDEFSQHIHCIQSVSCTSRITTMFLIYGHRVQFPGLRGFPTDVFLTISKYLHTTAHAHVVHTAPKRGRYYNTDRAKTCGAGFALTCYQPCEHFRHASGTSGSNSRGCPHVSPPFLRIL